MDDLNRNNSKLNEYFRQKKKKSFETCKHKFEWNMKPKATDCKFASWSLSLFRIKNVTESGRTRSFYLKVERQVY